MSHTHTHTLINAYVTTHTTNKYNVPSHRENLYTHVHNVNSLATTSGYVHLVEPGYLCTKQAL